MKRNKFLLKLMLFVVAAISAGMPLIESKSFAQELSTTEITIGDTTAQTAAKAMTIIEANSGRILASHNAEEKLPMASLTKIITAIVAIENTQDLDKVHEITPAAIGLEGSSIYLKAGEHLSMRELLYGLMLRSGNDSAVAIANIVSGSVDNFAKKCNEFCAKIGATNTNLVNPHGLHDDNHYTTASDLAKISAYAINNPVFKEIASTKQIEIPNELGKYAHRDLINKNRFLKMLRGANGIKTGYTKKAGRCFVGSTYRESDGMQVVCVLLNCSPMFQECKALTEKALEQYSMKELLPPEGYESSINIAKSEQLTTMAKSNNGFKYPLTKTEEDKISITNTLERVYTAPISSSESLGEVKIFLDKQLIFSDNIYSINNIENNSYSENLAKIIDEF